MSLNDIPASRVPEEQIIAVRASLRVLEEKDRKLLDQVFCSNLEARDDYIYLARKLGLTEYLELYEKYFGNI